MAKHRARTYSEQKRRRRKGGGKGLLWILLLILLLLLGIGIGAAVKQGMKKGLWASSKQSVSRKAAPKEKSSKEEPQLVGSQGDIAMVPAAEEGPAFLPTCTDNTRPTNMINFTEIKVGDEVLSDVSEYQPAEEITMGLPKDYTQVEGIVTFRGNNFRDNPTYGTASFAENTLKEQWSVQTGSVTFGDATWSGSGWTGQPLMEKWPQNVKQHMNMYDWAKEKEDLVEVIYACMDGYVYFLDLETGEATRDKLYLGFTFKGSGALDPRGYPILYVGAGYNSDEGIARVFLVNLMDCSVMMTFGNEDPFSLRGSLSFFDSSCLVDAETDTMIYPGENGILYLMKLNTSFDPEAGTLSINPDPMVRWHYYGDRSDDASFWIGMEDSCAVYHGYLFVADNGGHLMCLDLATLQLVWVQDILDDSNSSPVLSLENDHLYLYVSTSFRLGWRSDDVAEVPIWKIDAENGEIVWQKSYDCFTTDGVSGGVQSTIASGKNELSDYIYVTVARTGESYAGVLVCLNKQTGEVVWEYSGSYTWSSPVCVYDEEGQGRVLYCDSVGMLYLMDGKTGEVLNQTKITEGVIESSPAVFNSRLVVGTRDCEIKGIDIQ